MKAETEQAGAKQIPIGLCAADIEAELAKQLGPLRTELACNIGELKALKLDVSQLGERVDESTMFIAKLGERVYESMMSRQDTRVGSPGWDPLALSSNQASKVVNRKKHHSRHAVPDAL